MTNASKQACYPRQVPQKRQLWRGVIFFIVLWSVLAFPQIAQASTVSLYNNTSLDGNWASAVGVELAQSFSTGADPVGLNSVGFHYRNASIDNNISLASSYTLQLYAGNDNAPTSVLIATLAQDVPVGMWADQIDSYTPTAPISLAPYSQFFVVLSGHTGGTVGWKFNPATPTTDLNSTPSFISKISSDNGNTWSTLDGNFLMSVSGNVLAIPTLNDFSNVTAVQGQSPQAISPPQASSNGSSIPGSYTYVSSNPEVAAVGENQNLMFGSLGSATITAIFVPTDLSHYYSSTITAVVTVASELPPPPTTTTFLPSG